MHVNFGGFVPLSTVDWRGRAVCTVFFRGCYAMCYYCHNKHLQRGESSVPVEYILDLIDESRMLVSAVVFSGGECTEQISPLLHLAKGCWDRGLKVGIHTNGAFPQNGKHLIGKVDKISLDVKATWGQYKAVTGVDVIWGVKTSLALFRDANKAGILPEFEVVHTLFRGREAEVAEVAEAIGDVDLVLQQGVWGREPPLSLDEIRAVADRLDGRPVKIRTVSAGEVVYQGGTFSSGGGVTTRDGESLKAYHKFGVRRGE